MHCRTTFFAQSSISDHRRRVTCHPQAALLAAAAGSPTPDWLDKLTWLEAQLPRGGAEGRRRLGPKVRLAVMRAAAEAPWGAGARLRWLHQSGYEMEEEVGGVGGSMGRTHARVRGGRRCGCQEPAGCCRCVLDGTAVAHAGRFSSQQRAKRLATRHDV